jgi:hypothetical protein
MQRNSKLRPDINAKTKQTKHRGGGDKNEWLPPYTHENAQKMSSYQTHHEITFSTLPFWDCDLSFGRGR